MEQVGKTKFQEEQAQIKAKLLKRAQYSQLIKEMFHPSPPTNKKNNSRAQEIPQQSETRTTPQPIQKPKSNAFREYEKELLKPVKSTTEESIKRLNNSMQTLLKKTKEMESLTHKVTQFYIHFAVLTSITERGTHFG